MAETSELIQQAFRTVNKFKRHRTLMSSTLEGKDKLYHELAMYKQFDSLELTLRAINANEREEDDE